MIRKAQQYCTMQRHTVILIWPGFYYQKVSRSIIRIKRDGPLYMRRRVGCNPRLINLVLIKFKFLSFFLQMIHHARWIIWFEFTLKSLIYCVFLTNGQTRVRWSYSETFFITEKINRAINYKLKPLQPILYSQVLSFRFRFYQDYSTTLRGFRLLK